MVGPTGEGQDARGGGGTPTAWLNQGAGAPMAGGDTGGMVPADLSFSSRGFSEGVRSPADRGAVGGPRPEPQVEQDLLDDLRLVNDLQLRTLDPFPGLP